MKFSEVVAAFDELSAHTSRISITKILAVLFARATPHEARIIANLSLGSLYPSYQNVQFAIAEKTCIGALAEILGESEAQVMAEYKKRGDLGLVAREGQWKSRESLTVTQIYERLEKLAHASGAGSQEEKKSQLVTLLRDVDPGSALYIIRIIIGKLRLGFSDMTIIDALSWMAVGDKSVRSTIEQAYNMSADIGLVAETLKAEGIKGLHKEKIIVGIPIRPAGAERLPTAAAIVEKIGSCVAQPKIDGFRVQVHLDFEKKQHRVFFFSRNLNDMSEMFPDIAEDLKKLNISSLIAEGEAIVFNEETGDFSSFQETVKRKRKHDIAEISQKLPLKLFLFDILYLNGKSLIDVSHEERRAILKKTVHDAARVAVIEEREIKKAQELEEYFFEVLHEGLEGLVVKKPSAQYQPGKRNFNWIKLKRTEHSHLEDTVDAVILGYYAGRGKRAHFGIGAFLIGVFNEHEDRFETVAKIGTGLDDAGWKELKKKCDAERVEQKPRNVICARELEPDVWIVPTVVCTVRADEITRSPLHTAGKTADTLGLALRFPRFEQYRTDKSPRDVTTVKELKSLFAHQKKVKTKEV